MILFVTIKGPSFLSLKKSVACQPIKTELLVYQPKMNYLFVSLNRLVVCQPIKTELLVCQPKRDYLFLSLNRLVVCQRKLD